MDKVIKLEERTNRIESKAADKDLKKIESKVGKSELVNFSPLERPQTADVRSAPGYDPLISRVEAELDMDIQALLDRNRKQLDEIKYDMEEVKNVRPPRKKI